MRFDLSAVKRTRLIGRSTLKFRAEMLNAFNHPWFTPVTGRSTTSNLYNIPNDYRVTEGDSGRQVQFVTRVSW